MPARPAKRAAAFRTIGEVAGDLDLPTHVLRFWESKFAQLKPLKRSGGRRYYRPEDVVLLRRIRQCLYQDGYTIRGVQQLLDTPPSRPVAAETMPTLFPLEGEGAEAASSGEPSQPAKQPRRPRRHPTSSTDRAALEEIRRELLEARVLLDELLRGKTP